MAHVITTYSVEGFYSYGWRFIETFHQFWGTGPASDMLFCYADRIVDDYRGVTVRRDLSSIPELQGFQLRHLGNPMAHGRVPTSRWKSKDRDDGYSFRTDACKFAYKVFVIRDAARRYVKVFGDGFLAWCDADVVFFKPVPHGFVEELLTNHDVAFLGRGRAHSECGFLGFRLPEALPLIERWCAFYETDRFLQLEETHDSYLFDLARHLEPTVRQLNMTPEGYAHTWMRSPLAAFSDHLKGQRKRLGYSPEMRDQR